MAADFNGDDRPDLAVADQRIERHLRASWPRGRDLPGPGDNNPVGNDPVGVVTADLNHDGYLDIITANYYSNEISVLMGNGDGTFQAAESFPAGTGPTALVVGDFNGDGRLDVAVADSGNGNGDQQGVSILLGNGDGTFQAPVFYAAGAYPSSIVAGDFTGNGVLDLAVDQCSTPTMSRSCWATATAGFRPAPARSTRKPGVEPVSIVAGDFTGGGVLDLAVLNQVPTTSPILQGDGNGGFQALSPPISLDVPLDIRAGAGGGRLHGQRHARPGRRQRGLRRARSRFDTSEPGRWRIRCPASRFRWGRA